MWLICFRIVKERIVENKNTLPPLQSMFFVYHKTILFLFLLTNDINTMTLVINVRCEICRRRPVFNFII